MAIPFISSTDLENYLGYTVDPDKALIALDASCDNIRKTVEQDLDFVADDEVTLDGTGQDYLLLPEMPIYSVSSVIQHHPFSSDIALAEGTDWVLDKEDGTLKSAFLSVYTSPRSQFTLGRQNYTVTYSHGYVTDSSVPGLPADVQEWPSSLRLVALQLATRIYEQGIVASETVGSVSASYSVVEGILVSAGERDILEKVVGIGRRR